MSPFSRFINHRYLPFVAVFIGLAVLLGWRGVDNATKHHQCEAIGGNFVANWGYGLASECYVSGVRAFPWKD